MGVPEIVDLNTSTFPSVLLIATSEKITSLQFCDFRRGVSMTVTADESLFAVDTNLSVTMVATRPEAS
jgi:hypothetical protein